MITMEDLGRLVNFYFSRDKIAIFAKKVATEQKIVRISTNAGLKQPRV